MRDLMRSRTGRRLGLALGAAGVALTAAPVLAQTYYTVPEVVVTPERLGPDGRPVTLSRTVNISDLDLRYDRDVREMRQRVRTTARRICEDLGETSSIPSVERDCASDAVRRTEHQMRVAINEARSPAYYAYAIPAPAPVAPYAGYYAPPASAVVPVYPADPDAYVPPPDL
jgi:UrcA family protein